jgi:hypothetical protein
LRKNILLFYGNLDGPNATRKDQKRWRTIVKQLEELKLRSPRDTASRPAR